MLRQGLLTILRLRRSAGTTKSHGSLGRPTRSSIFGKLLDIAPCLFHQHGPKSRHQNEGNYRT